MVTISAVRPPARFGALKLKESEVLSFKEKSQLKENLATLDIIDRITDKIVKEINDKL